MGTNETGGLAGGAGSLLSGLAPTAENPAEPRVVPFVDRPAVSASEETCTGSVTQWDEKGGFGFVQLQDGRRAYVHHSAFGSGNLTVGEQVFVTVCPDQRNAGKWMVKTLFPDTGGLTLDSTASI